MICPGVVIGDHAIVAAGSVVTRDVAAFTMVAGSPAVQKRAWEPDESSKQQRSAELSLATPAPDGCLLT
ncbi:hypothetical protein [Cupriavidus sp. L7L]|uniref:acyltransferase n=1 Tax=Cupriavidus sp. L7L TaxID=2546443 RepID=UPI00352C32BC